MSPTPTPIVEVKIEASSPTSEPEISKCGPWRSGNVLRLDVPTPFFLNNDVFKNFKSGEYSWHGAEDKMVLLVASNESGRVPVVPLEGVKIKTEGDNYSIGGCPLECPFDVNEDFEGALDLNAVPLVFSGLRIPNKYTPFEIDEGHNAIAKVSKNIQPFVQELRLANSADREWFTDDTLVFAFVDGTPQNSGLTFIGCRRPFKSVDLHVMGRFRPDSEMLSIDDFRRYHEQNLFAENRPMTMIAHSIYEKLHGEYPSKGKVYLEYLYRNPVGVFDLPPEDSSSKIAIRPLPGDANPFVEVLWDEIQDLEKWITILAESSGAATDCTSFLNLTVQDMNEMSENVNMKAVQELLGREPVLDLHRISSIEFSDSLDLVLKRVVEQERADYDFTDRLWSTVRKCENREELQECLQAVFQAVANKMYRPYLLISNGTTMAKKLTMVMKGEVATLLRIAQYEIMIKMIIECGMMKLFKDYNFALAMSHLIERGEIDSFMPNVLNIPTSLENLQKLHCILEIMCLSKERLTLSVNYQQGHVKQLLKYFSTHPMSWERTYHFDVPSNDLRTVTAGLHPIFFKVKMDSQTSLKWATTTVVVSPEAYINYRRNPNEESHIRQYYVYVLCECGRRLE